MAALSKAEANSAALINLTEQALTKHAETSGFVPPVSLNSQMQLVVSLAQSYIDFLEKSSISSSTTACMSATLSLVKPLLEQYISMLNLLVRAGVEINGNPFLDSDTVLSEIRTFLANRDIARILPEAIEGIQEDQIEILEDLTGKDFPRAS